MNETKQPVQNREKDTARSVFWGTIALDVIAMLVFGYFLVFILRLEKTPIIYLGMAVFLATFLAALSSLILTIRGKQKLGAEISLYSLSSLGITMIAIFQGRTLTASFSIFTISIITILYLLPRHSRRWYLSVAVFSVVAMWVFEWIKPSWRIQLGAANVGPVAVVVFALILVGTLVYQARYRFASSLRNKLVVSVIGITVVSAGILAGVNYYNVSRDLTTSAGNSLKSLANSQAAAISNVLIQEAHTLQSFSLSKVVQDRVDEVNTAYGPDDAANLQNIQLIDQQWRVADANNDDNAVVVKPVLNSDVASELREFQETFPENAEVFVTDRYGANVAATNRTSDYYQADEDWWQAAYNNGKGAIYFGQPEFDESSQTFGIILAVPLVEHGTNQVNGVMRTTLSIDKVLTILSAPLLGGTAHTDLYLPGNQALAPEESTTALRPSDPEALSRLAALINNKPYETFTLDGELSVVSAASIASTDPAEQDAIDNLGWTLIVDQTQADNQAPVRQEARSTLLVSLLIIGLSTGVAYVLSQSLARPISNLTEVAQKVSAGDITVQAKIESHDEIGTLATTFNNMTAQLSNSIATLEERVAARTRNLELAAQVGRAVSQVRDLNVMLKDAAELILKEFNLYYVQVYLTDPAQRNLVLEAGTGDVGAQLLARAHSLPLNTGSINGRAAVEQKSVVISDTAKSATFRKNPLLPETRGEMAVPLIVAGKVVGVLDMQSKQPGVLTEEVLPAFEALAGQLAVAVQNANLLAETEQARAQVEAQARRLVRTGWNDHLDAIHKPEQLGYVFAQNSVTPLADVDDMQLSDNTRSVSVPIAVTGEELGSLVVEIDDEARAEQTNELVNIVARQVAQQIENLRLLESAERYRFEAERTAQLQTIEGWQKYVASKSAESLGYVYDTKEVRPQNGNGGADASMFALPIKAREEMIGKLSVQGLAQDDQESVELVNAVAERLSAHIENLRLFEETRLGQVELDKRARQLAAVAEISTASSQELEVDKLLETVVRLTQRQFDLYHAHVFVLNDETQSLDIVACGWEEGSEHEGNHESNSIPLDREQSLVARAARTGRAVIVNNVKSESGWLPNPLLPNTESEMAVPLVVGDRVLGVLDVQANRVNAFSDEDANIQTTLASQVATAMQNARSFTLAQKQAEREAMLNIINQKIQSATSVEAVLQIAARELGTALGAPMTVAQLSMKDNSS